MGREISKARLRDFDRIGQRADREIRAGGGKDTTSNTNMRMLPRALTASGLSPLFLSTPFHAGPSAGTKAG
jgi:hypothetical protein